MPLGSEIASLTGRGLAAVRAAGQHAAAPWANEGAPITVAPIQPGAYTPATAILSAVTNFASGARESANYRGKIAALRSQQQQEQAYRQAQITNMATDNERTERFHTDDVAYRNAVEERLNHPPAPAARPEPTGLAADLIRSRIAANNRANTSTAAATQGIAALKAREQGIDTEEQGLNAEGEANSRAVANSLMTKAMSDDKQALAALGLTGDIINGMDSNQKAKAIVDAAQRYGDQLRSQYKVGTVARTGAKRSVINSRLDSLSGLEMPQEDAGPDAMDALIQSLTQ